MKQGNVVTLLGRIAQTILGAQTKIVLLRKGKEITLKAQVGKRPKPRF
jgi:S1-C subfamily serine protease